MNDNDGGSGIVDEYSYSISSNKQSEDTISTFYKELVPKVLAAEEFWARYAGVWRV